MAECPSEVAAARPGRSFALGMNGDSAWSGSYLTEAHLALEGP